jgi:hypothetical protein
MDRLGLEEAAVQGIGIKDLTKWQSQIFQEQKRV